MSDQLMPAIAGGEPAKRTPFTRERRYGAEEMAELQEALEQGSLFYAHGKKVFQLEEEFAACVGAQHAVATSSGTASIHAAMIALGISPGDEVITSPITDMGSLVPILYQGGIPVFADLDPRSYVLDPESVRAAITPRTRAVLAVHLWGNACNLEVLARICEEHGLHLIEDCAQAFCCEFKGKPAGRFGAVGCFSLNEFKHIGCGDAGLVVTDDPELAHLLRLATDKGYDRRPGVTDRNPTFLCANYRMTELQGAVGRAQLRKLDEIVRRRRQWCGALSERLAGIDGLLLPHPTPGSNPSWWFYMMRVVPQVLGADADQFAEALKAEGLPVSAHYIGRCVYEYEVFTRHSAFRRGSHPFSARTYEKGLCPRAEEILDTAVMLAINEGYTATDLEETVEAVTRAAKWFAESAKVA